MRHSIRSKIAATMVFASVGFSGVCFEPASAQSPSPSPFQFYLENADAIETTPIGLVQFEDPSRESTQPLSIQGDSALSSLRSDQSLSDILISLRKAGFEGGRSSSVDTKEQQDQLQTITQRVDTGITATAPVQIVPASTFNLTSQPDVAETIASTSTAPTVKTQRRSPIAMDPRIRGYRGAQIYTMMDGAALSPVRPDLDAILAKVDQSLIGSTQIISGPYGLRYGSGFSFINVDTIPTPRYLDGRENHLRLGTHVRTNGGQTYNTATLFGGGEVGGYFVNAGYRKGSDYEAGDGLAIPSSYEALNLFSGYGRDLSENLRMETKFTLLDQGETEYAAQFFDVDALNHYGLTHSFIYDNDRTGFGFRVDGWVSDTSFNGDTSLGGKRRDDFPVLQRVDAALRAASPDPPATAVLAGARFQGIVNGDIFNTGFRAGLTRDQGKGFSYGAGTDLRFLRHTIDENYDISGFGFGAEANQFQTGMPQADLIEPGLYGEMSKEINPFWNVAGGARVAFASTSINGRDLSDQSNFKDAGGAINRDLDQNDTLVSCYLTNDLELTDHWSARVGAGYAERAPELTDRYSDGLFLAVIQSGFSRVIGNPELNKERNVQIDLRLDADYENIRGRLSGYHAWIQDYNTYAANAIIDPLGARLLQAINTDEATLAGFEGYAEADLLDGFQAFGSLAYIDGRDREIDQPLPGIFPLESRIGMRVRDLSPENRWGIEWGWRIVDNQDRLAFLRAVTDGLPPIQLETPTPGFATSYLRSFYRPNDRFSFTAGIENMFDRNYYEHLNLRLPADGAFGQTIVLSPGIMPYFGAEVEY